MAGIKKLKSGAVPSYDAGNSVFKCTVDLQWANNGSIKPNYNAQAAVSQGTPKESRY